MGKQRLRYLANRVVDAVAGPVIDQRLQHVSRWDAVYCGDHVVLTRTPSGAKIYVDMWDTAVAVFPTLGEPYEPYVAALLKHVTRPGDTVFDVSASFGYHSLELMRHLGWRPADVHLFEPNPTVAACLRRSIAGNGLGDGMHLVEAAVGSAKGNLPLRVTEDAWGSATLSDKLNATDRPHELRVTEEIEVPVITLDEYCAERAAATVA